ncbi:hypothetical protein GCM10023184_35830 [Flaviaesturariibacter amylovorans]|uniref:DUF559 domain-containing protein n=1 Tax=Flaviaesturariibacter amylovorans TaxID=1084520 RepID=A0ABP8HGF0_9BACT
MKGKRLAGYKFRRQHVIGNYIVDFVCLKRKLIVEVDGDIHLAPSQQRYDEDRTEFLEANGFRVIRFWNDAVLERLDAVLDTILETLNAG